MQIMFNTDGLDMYDLSDVLHNLWQLDYILDYKIDNDDNEQKLMDEITKQSAESGLHYYEVKVMDNYKDLNGIKHEIGTITYSITSAKENPSRQEIIDFINKIGSKCKNKKIEDFTEEDIENIREITVQEVFFNDNGCWPSRDRPILR